MRVSSFLTTAAVASLATLVVGEEATDSTPSDVLTLTTSTFESSVNPEELILVEFYAPWCGHCKALAPEYEQAATTLKEKNLKIAKVDCVDEAELCQTHGVQGYPTLKVFRNGTPTDYTGPRKADGIVSYMVKQSLPAVSEVSTSNYAEFIKADKVVVVAYVATSTDEPAPEFSSVAQKHRDDYLFGISSDKDLIEKEGIKTPSIVVYRSFDEAVSEYPYPPASATVEDIENWVKELSVPTLDEVSGENYGIYAQSDKPLAYLFIDPTSDKKEEYLAAFKPVATQYKSKMNFVWIDAIKFADHGKALNLPEVKWPAFVIQDLSNQLKYPLDQSKDFTPEAAIEQIVGFLGKTIEPTLKSEPIPEKQDESVYTLVGKEFDQVVFDDSKDVFLELYATWCGHCKRLKPIWDSLGDHFSSVKDRVTIAKMEATENDLPASVPFRVTGFPTIKFKPAGSREFIDYEGDRSLENMIAFVDEHAKNSLTPPVEAESAQVPVSGGSTPASDAPVTEEEAPVKEVHDEL